MQIKKEGKGKRKSEPDTPEQSVSIKAAAKEWVRVKAGYPNFRHRKSQ